MSLVGKPRGIRKISRRRLLVLIGLCEFRAGLKAEEKRDQFIRLTDSDLVLETRLETLGRNWITANEDFFVLSRAPVDVSEEERSHWQLSIGGEVEHAIDLSIEELRNPKIFPRVDVYACIQCAGYGRRFFEPAFEVAPWGVGAIGNAHWRGVRLADVLERATVRGRHSHSNARNGTRAATNGGPRRPSPLLQCEITGLVRKLNGRPLLTEPAPANMSSDV